MSILTALLRQSATVEPYEGESASGPLFSPATATYPARLEPKRRQLTSTHGQVIVSDGLLYLRPEAAIKVGDRVTVEEIVYRVLSVATLMGLMRAEYIEATLGRSEA